MWPIVPQSCELHFHPTSNMATATGICPLIAEPAKMWLWMTDFQAASDYGKLQPRLLLEDEFENRIGCFWSHIIGMVTGG